MRRRKPVASVRESVSLYEAKTHLSELVDQAAQGREIVIAKSGKPKARLVPLVPKDTRRLRKYGLGKGRGWIAFLTTFFILSKVAWPGLAAKMEARELRIAEGLRKAEEAEE